MMEDIGELLRRGFSVWKGNLILCLPFLLSTVISMLILLAFMMGIFLILMPQGALSSMAFEDAKNVTVMQGQMEELLKGLGADQLALAVLFFIGIMLLILMVDAFFSAGAIGMARQALETGKADTSAMWSSGRRHFWNLFLATLLTWLITLAGLIFLLPALAISPDPLAADAGVVGILAAGLLLFLLYALAVSIALIAMPYALVTEDMGPFSALQSALKFFRYNKFDVAVLWLIAVALSAALQMAGGAAGDGAGGQPLSLIASLANLVVLAPLSCIWWTRLYMNRNGMLNVDEVKDPW